MEEVKKLIEKGIGRITVLIVFWNVLSQEYKEALDFKTLSKIWESPSMNGKDEIWALIKNKAKRFNDYVYVLEETFGDKYVYFYILKKKAKTFNQKMWLWNNIDYYSEEKNSNEKEEIWNDLKKTAKTLSHWTDLWINSDNSDDKDEAFLMLKGKIETFENCQDLLYYIFFSGSKEWNEVYSIAKEKAESFEDYYYVYEKESGAENMKSLWEIVKSKAETLEQRIILFEMANEEHSEECLNFARLKL